VVLEDLQPYWGLPDVNPQSRWRAIAAERRRFVSPPRPRRHWLRLHLQKALTPCLIHCRLSIRNCSPRPPPPPRPPTPRTRTASRGARNGARGGRARAPRPGSARACVCPRAAKLVEPQRAAPSVAARRHTINSRHARRKLRRRRVHPRRPLSLNVRHRAAPREGRRGRSTAC
jgi:hypothetical protein